MYRFRKPGEKYFGEAALKDKWRQRIYEETEEIVSDNDLEYDERFTAERDDFGDPTDYTREEQLAFEREIYRDIAEQKAQSDMAAQKASGDIAEEKVYREAKAELLTKQAQRQAVDSIPDFTYNYPKPLINKLLELLNKYRRIFNIQAGFNLPFHEYQTRLFKHPEFLREFQPIREEMRALKNKRTQNRSAAGKRRDRRVPIEHIRLPEFRNAWEAVCFANVSIRVEQ